MKKIVFLFVALSTVAASLSAGQTIVSAADATPPVGGWQWCTTSNVNGCIQSLTTISPEKVETTYTSAANLPAGMQLSVTCTPNSSVNTCDTNRYVTREDGQCAEAPTWGGRFTTPSIEIDINWAGKVGWGIRLRLSTGNFRAAFSIGFGTTSSITTSDGDGTYTYVNTSVIGKSYTATAPQSVIALTGTPQYQSAYTEWLKTAIATSEREAIHVQVWPRDHLLRPANPYSPKPTDGTTTVPSVPVTPTGCQYYPFDGAFAEANATGFSWSYSSGATSPNVPNVLKFMAQAPHYLPQVNNEPLQVMPARVQVFLPTSFFSALGYASLSEFNASSYSVTTEDGQKTSPSIEIRENGILINLGLQHYSAPNPSVTITPKSIPSTATNEVTSTPPATSPVVVSKPFVALKKLARKKSAPLSVFISYRLPGTKSWKVSGGCTIVKSTLRAPARPATCKLTLTVRNSKKRVIATKSHSIRVS